MEPTLIPLAAESVIETNLLVPLGGLAALLAMLGMALVLPLYLTQRREITRLLEWQEREPDAGESLRQDAASASPSTGGMRTAGPMTAAERVTSERPALTRVGTTEHATLEQPPSFWGRVVDRGPRHPLVISLLALFIAAALFVAAALLLRAGEDESGGKGIDPSATSVVIVNASSSTGLAGQVADGLEQADFAVAGTSVTEQPANRSVVRYGQGSRAAAAAVARRLAIQDVEPFDAEAEAAADGAQVVVVAGEDRAEALAGEG